MDSPRLLLSEVHRRRKIGLWLAIIPLAATLICVAPLVAEHSIAEEAIEWVGYCLIGLAIAGRTWCTLYVGGRKRSHLVSVGPYSLSRNPLYVFSVVGALGMGMASGSATLGVAFAVFAYVVFGLVIRHEEAYLSDRHGARYADYLSNTPRWLSTRASWRDSEKLEVRPRLVLTTFRDACAMLIAVPLFEAFGSLHASGFLPSLLHLP